MGVRGERGTEAMADADTLLDAAADDQHILPRDLSPKIVASLVALILLIVLPNFLFAPSPKSKED